MECARSDVLQLLSEAIRAPAASSPALMREMLWPLCEKPGSPGHLQNSLANTTAATRHMSEAVVENPRLADPPDGHSVRRTPGETIRKTSQLISAQIAEPRDSNKHLFEQINSCYLLEQ